MDKFESYREQIEAYVQGRMEEEQQQRFEQILAERAELKAEVDLLMSYRQSFQRKDLIDFQAALSKASAAHALRDETIQIKKRRTQYWLVAAAVVGVLVLTVMLWNRQPKQDYLEYAQIDVPFSTYRSDDIEQIDSLYLYLESQVSIGNIEGEKLESLIEMIVEAAKNETYLRRYQLANEILLARAYLLDGKAKSALRIIEKNWPENMSACSINYYRTIALLELDRKEEAREILEKLDCPDINQTLTELLEIARRKQP
ncbi:MAG: hypothetical protein AAF587_34355 [Bacteroidota bacterium]